MLGLLNTVLSKGNTLLTYVKDGLVMANRFLTPPKLTFPVDASAEFNGSSDYILSPVDVNSGTLSVGAWCYYDGTKSLNSLLNFRPHTTLAISLNRTGANDTYVYIGNGTSWIGIPAITATATEANKWFYLSFTADGTTSKLYIDGSLVGSYAGVPTGMNTDAFPIGAISATPIGLPLVYAEKLSGNLANVAIWNRALSSDEINSVMWKTYEQVSTTESNGLQAWYKLSADEVLSGDSTATLTAYANANKLTFEAPACVQTALNGLPDITDARLYSANYDIRVKADGGTVESLSCVETELNAIL